MGIALGRAPLVDEELASGRLVPLMPRLKLAGSWGYVMRMQPNRPMDAALPALVEFLAEEGRSRGMAESGAGSRLILARRRAAPRTEGESA